MPSVSVLERWQNSRPITDFVAILDGRLIWTSDTPPTERSNSHPSARLARPIRARRTQGTPCVLDRRALFVVAEFVMSPLRGPVPPFHWRGLPARVAEFKAAFGLGRLSDASLERENRPQP